MSFLLSLISAFTLLVPQIGRIQGELMTQMQVKPVTVAMNPVDLFEAPSREIAITDEILRFDVEPPRQRIVHRKPQVPSVVTVSDVIHPTPTLKVSVPVKTVVPTVINTQNPEPKPAPTPTPMTQPQPQPITPPIQTPPPVQIAAQTTPTPVPTVKIPVGEAPTQSFSLTIPKIGLSEIPVSPTDYTNDARWKADLINGVGQILSAPGLGHKTVIFGHSSNFKYVISKFNYIFEHLNLLEIGDRITVNYQGRQYTYQVAKKEIIGPDTPSIVTDYNRDELILFTCWPKFTSTNRVVVYANPLF